MPKCIMREMYSDDSTEHVYECTNCGGEFELAELDGWINCPNCGADITKIVDYDEDL